MLFFKVKKPIFGTLKTKNSFYVYLEKKIIDTFAC